MTIGTNRCAIAFALRAALASSLSLTIAVRSEPALAYRPFDGTDAAVADAGEMEVELGPVGYLREGQDRTLLAPDVRFNYGFADGWEAVAEGQVAHGLSVGDLRSSLRDNGVSLKKMLRDGSLQNMTGPSIATEVGLLLPGINGEPGTGSSIAGIVSERWPWATVHVNLMGAVTREQHADLFLSLIVEGPNEWSVRPVAELLYEREFGGSTTRSAHIGAIWQARENLACDVGLRGGRMNDHTLAEIRAGLTFGFRPF